MQCNYNSFIQIINFHGLFRNALRCRKTGACRILVLLRCPYMFTQKMNTLKSWHTVHVHVSKLTCRIWHQIMLHNLGEGGMWEHTGNITYKGSVNKCTHTQIISNLENTWLLHKLTNNPCPESGNSACCPLWTRSSTFPYDCVNVHVSNVQSCEDRD